MKQTFRLAGLVSMLALLAACEVTRAPERAYEVNQPGTRPVRNVTSFSESLSCMDNLFASFGVQNIIITSAGIPDQTGEIGGGTKDMLISALSRMSVKSNAFVFVDFDNQGQVDVAQLQQLVGFTDEFRVPNYYIRGAITQLDQGVLAETVGGGVGIPEFDIGLSKDQIVSVISVDMNVGDLMTRQILPGTSVSNSIAVARRGQGADASATLGEVGLAFNISLNQSEGRHQATRTLIEMSAIQIVGKLTRVPYWRCLQIEQTNPKMVAQARDWFDTMSATDQVAFVQRALAGEGYYNGAASGQLDQTTKGAVARYQADNGLLADGRVDFDLYQRLISDDLALGTRPTAVQANATAPDQPAQPTQTTQPPLSLRLASANGSTYRVADDLKLTVEATQDSYVYCYYRDARGDVSRIFPNQFRPDPYVNAGTAVHVPSDGSPFSIVFDEPGAQEEVACVASYKEIGMNLPTRLKVADLTPMPVQSIDEVVGEFRRLDQANLAEARLRISVAQ